MAASSSGISRYTGIGRYGTDMMPFGYFYFKNDYSKREVKLLYKAEGRCIVGVIPIDELPAVDSKMTVKPSEEKFFMVKWDPNRKTPEKILKLPFIDVTTLEEDEEFKMHDEADLNARMRRVSMAND